MAAYCLDMDGMPKRCGFQTKERREKIETRTRKQVPYIFAFAFIHTFVKYSQTHRDTYIFRI